MGSSLGSCSSTLVLGAKVFSAPALCSRGEVGSVMLAQRAFDVGLLWRRSGRQAGRGTGDAGVTGRGLVQRSLSLGSLSSGVYVVVLKEGRRRT